MRIANPDDDFRARIAALNEACECCGTAITADNRNVSGGMVTCSLTCESRAGKAQEASRVYDSDAIGGSTHETWRSS